MPYQPESTHSQHQRDAVESEELSLRYLDNSKVGTKYDSMSCTLSSLSCLPELTVTTFALCLKTLVAYEITKSKVV